MHDETVTLPDGRVLDVQVLKELASQKTTRRRLLLSTLQGVSTDSVSGYSAARLAATNLVYPVIISSSRVVLDGRHRILKLMNAARRTAVCVQLTEDDIRSAERG